MSSTIFPSLTTFFGGNGHHSPPHSTVSPNQQFHSQNLAIMALIFPRVILWNMPSRVNYMGAVGILNLPRVIRNYNVIAPPPLIGIHIIQMIRNKYCTFLTVVSFIIR
ncbi:hypothetical protein Hanom_Chr09g00768751 [Helianthus anomalus]